VPMQVFISHNRQNAPAALKLCDRLTALGAQTWLDLRDLESGADWREQVPRAIEGAHGFVFLVGPPGPSDYFQRSEWQMIAERDPDKPLVPVVLGEAELPGFLRTRHAIHVDEGSVDFDKLAADVLERLQSGTMEDTKVEEGIQARKESMAQLEAYAREIER
jgi:hypothetical protein